MKPPEEVRAEFTREWLQKAEGDFKTAGHLLQSGTDFLDGATFHSQQAAEKYLKAFLVWLTLPFIAKNSEEKRLLDVMLLAMPR